MGALLMLVMGYPAHATPFPGPDDSGYTATEIGENLRAIAGLGIVPADDTVSAALPIGFSFNFYGTDYTEAYVSSNGFLSFGPVSNGCCGGQVLPAADGIDNVVVGFWTDLCPGCGGAVRYETIGTAPNREFVVHFDDSFYCCGPPETVNFQIILHEDSDIELQYGQLDDQGRTVSVGIENDTGTIGLQIMQGDITTSDLQNRGFMISTSSPAPPPPTIYHHLNVAKAGTGTGTVTGDPHLWIDCGSSCSSYLAQWTFGTLVATPEEGSEFSGWSGPCLDWEGDAPDECTIHLSGDQTVTAAFTVLEPPTPPPPSVADHSRVITLEEMAHEQIEGGTRLVIQGVLESEDGFAPCSSDQEVVLQKRVQRRWRDRMMGSTDDAGVFRFSHRDATGWYRVVARHLTLPGDPVSNACLRAASELLHNIN